MSDSAAVHQEQATLAECPPRRRIVLLGASNLARGVASAVQSARAAFEGPFDLIAALGHGRSYGRGSWVLGRWLPGIVDCHLWQDLIRRQDDLPARALVADVGNDILYGAPPEQIIEWVELCICRLRDQNCEVAITGIPLESLQRMRKWEFPLFRSIFYPGCRLSHESALGRATELAAMLEQLAAVHQCRFIMPDVQWYGIDRIHITKRSQATAWKECFSAFDGFQDGDARAATLREFVAIRSQTPHHRRLFGIPQRRRQPCKRLGDGTLVSLY